MTSGFELDELVAAKVMGWNRFTARNKPHPFSSDRAYAWLIVERLNAKWAVVVAGCDLDWKCLFAERTETTDGIKCEGRGTTISEAICRAALKVVANKDDDKDRHGPVIPPLFQD